MRSFVIYGEAFVVLKIGDDGELRLLLLPVAQVDPGFNEDLGPAGWVISGIHIARDGRRLRYRVSADAARSPVRQHHRSDMDRRRRRGARPRSHVSGRGAGDQPAGADPHAQRRKPTPRSTRC